MYGLVVEDVVRAGRGRDGDDGARRLLALTSGLPAVRPHGGGAWSRRGRCGGAEVSASPLQAPLLRVLDSPGGEGRVSPDLLCGWSTASSVGALLLPVPAARCRPPHTAFSSSGRRVASSSFLDARSLSPCCLPVPPFLPVSYAAISVSDPLSRITARGVDADPFPFVPTTDPVPFVQRSLASLVRVSPLRPVRVSAVSSLPCASCCFRTANIRSCVVSPPRSRCCWTVNLIRFANSPISSRGINLPGLSVSGAAAAASVSCSLPAL